MVNILELDLGQLAAAESWFSEVKEWWVEESSNMSIEDLEELANADHKTWLSSRSHMAKCVKTVDLCPFVSLRSVTLDMTSLLGWAPERTIGLPHEMARIAHVLPSSFQTLKLLYNDLGWQSTLGNISFTLGRNSFDHIRNFIEDAGEPLADDINLTITIMVPKLREIQLKLDCWVPKFVLNQLESMQTSAALKGIDLNFQEHR